MGRKRISSSRRPPTDNNDQDNGNFAIDKSASMRAMSSFDDARVGSEDEFDDQRQMIALEDHSTSAGRQKRARRQGNHYIEADEEMSEDEVLGLDMGSSSDDEDDDEEVAFDDDEEEDEDEILLRNLKKGLKRSLNDSDNEQGGEDDDDEEDETAWGRSKRAYYNGEDLIEGRNKNRDDENDEIEKEEEAEAMRLQKKRAAAMMESDFIEDSFASRLHRTEEAKESVISSSSLAPTGTATDSSAEQDDNDTLFDISSLSPDLTEEQRISILEEKAPDYMGFKREFELRWQEVEMMRPIVKATSADSEDSLAETKYLGRAVHYIHLKYRLLTMYTTNLAFYLHLRVSPLALSMPASYIRTHPCLSVILSLKENLDAVEERVEGRHVRQYSATAQGVAPEAKRPKKNVLNANKNKVVGMPALMEAVDFLFENASLDNESDGEGEDEAMEGEDEGTAVETGDDDDDEEEEEDDDGNDMDGFEGLDEIEAAVDNLVKHRQQQKDQQQQPTIRKSSSSNSSMKRGVSITSFNEISLPVRNTELLEQHLTTNTTSNNKKNKKKTKSSAASNLQKSLDYGETLEMDQVDMEDKMERRRNVQFHVQRVDKAAEVRKRKLAQSGGDQDIPYLDKFGRIMTERIKEQEQLQRELSAAAMGQGDDETKETDNGSSNKSKLLSKKAMAGVVVETSAGDDFDFGKEFVGEKVNGSGNKKRKQSDVMFDDHGDNSEDFEHDNLEDGDKNATPRPDHEFHDDEKLALEYYNSMTEAKKRNKADRQAQGAEINEISLEDIMALEGGEEGDADAAASSKRAISYQIMKNKGLTPHRKKENRNPRVKRRNRYESAMKKLKTFKRVAVDRSKMGGYGGEMTGIKTSLARSVKL